MLSDVSISEKYEFASSYFDLLIKHFAPLSEFTSTIDFPSVTEKYRHREGGHLLFRPVGLKITTRIITCLLNQKYTLRQSVRLASQLPMEISEPPFNKVIWNPVKKKMIPSESNTKLAVDLLLYMVKKYQGNVDDLRQRYADMLEITHNQPELPQILPEKK